MIASVEGVDVSNGSGRRGAWKWVSLGAAILAVALPQSASAAKPDLTVPFANLTSKPWIFQLPAQTVAFQDRTRNDGAGPADPSVTRLILVKHLTGTPLGYRGPFRDVPSLAPGAVSRGGVSRSLDASRVAFGGYYAQACADFNRNVDERDETNNCRFAERLSVIPRRWTGTVSGAQSYGVPGVNETWSGHVTFVFDPGLSGPANLDYEASNGTIHYKTSGTDSYGCTWSGSGTYSGPQDGGLEITSYFSHYHGAASHPGTWPGYEVTVNGPVCNSSFMAPGQGWFSTPSKPITPLFGVAALDDQYYDSASLTKYDWNLAAVP
jgi:hypothetical protein